MTRTKHFDSAACQIVYGEYVNGPRCQFINQAKRWHCLASMSLQALAIDFNSILQIAIEAIKAYDRIGPELHCHCPSPGIAALTMSSPHVTAIWCLSLARLRLPRLGSPRGHCINERQHAKQSKAARQSEAARLVRSLSYEQRQDKSRHSSRGAACGCNQQAAHCSPAVPYYVRSTEAAASNDCYYIYRLGHYNKISKYLVIIQFESCHKSGCKRATVVCWHWRCKLPLLLLLGQHTRTHCRLLVICQQ